MYNNNRYPPNLLLVTDKDYKMHYVIYTILFTIKTLPQTPEYHVMLVYEKHTEMYRENRISPKTFYFRTSARC